MKSMGKYSKIIAMALSGVIALFGGLDIPKSVCICQALV